MRRDQPNDPLHGVTLKALLEDLIARHGWDGLADRVPLACFQNAPSLNSSLKFLRKTPWARAKVERLYLADRRHAESRRKRNQRRAEMRAHRAAQEATAEGSADAAEGELPDAAEGPAVDPAAEAPDDPLA